VLASAEEQAQEQEEQMGEPTTSDDELRRILKDARNIAVLGAHTDPGRAAHYVAAYLCERGYQVRPVNAALAGQELFGATVTATLAELGEPIDVVDVFRRADKLEEHLADILAMSPRPRVVWLQAGIRNDAFAASLAAAGIEVVQDRCTMAEHRRLL
jgi:uncharacterized protein